MELAEFIKESLSQITKGINDFNDGSNNATAYPKFDTENPPSDVLKDLGMIYLGESKKPHNNETEIPSNASPNHRYAMLLNFELEIAVDETKVSNKDGGAKLKILGTEIGGEGKTSGTETSESIQKVSFVIPLEI